MSPRLSHAIASCLAIAALSSAMPAARAQPAVESSSPMPAGPTLGEIRGTVARGDLATALQQAQAAVRVRPDDAQLRFLLGVVQMDLRLDAEALATFTALTERYPELPDPMNNVALLHARAGRLDDARLSLQAALRADPSHRAARLNLGQVYLMLAVQAWEQAASTGLADAALARRLEAARALVSGTAR